MSFTFNVSACLVLVPVIKHLVTLLRKVPCKERSLLLLLLLLMMSTGLFHSCLCIICIPQMMHLSWQSNKVREKKDGVKCGSIWAQLFKSERKIILMGVVWMKPEWVWATLKMSQQISKQVLFEKTLLKQKLVWSQHVTLGRYVRPQLK